MRIVCDAAAQLNGGGGGVVKEGVEEGWGVDLHRSFHGTAAYNKHMLPRWPCHSVLITKTRLEESTEGWRVGRRRECIYIAGRQIVDMQPNQNSCIQEPEVLKLS